MRSHVPALRAGGPWAGRGGRPSLRGERAHGKGPRYPLCQGWGVTCVLILERLRGMESRVASGHPQLGGTAPSSHPEVGMKRTESPNRSQGAGGAEPSPGAQGSQSTQPPGPSVQALAVDPLFRSDAPHGHRGPGHTLPSLWGPLSAPWRLNQPHLSVHLGQGGRTHPRRLLKPRLCGELSESSGRAPRGPLGAGRKLRLVCSPQRQRSAPDAGTPPCPPTLCLAQGWHRGTHGVAG